MELNEAIEKRRSVRRFTDYYVTDEEIRKMIEAARWAPSWSNTQTWSFIIVRDPYLIKDVTETYSKTNPARLCSLSASAILVACAKKGLSGCKNGIELTTLRNWFMFDLGLAVQTICLKAYELGIGTVIVGSMDHKACKAMLSVPDDYEVLVAIPMGRSAEGERSIPARKSVESMTYMDRFAENYFKQETI